MTYAHHYAIADALESARRNLDAKHYALTELALAEAERHVEAVERERRRVFVPVLDGSKPQTDLTALTYEEKR